MPFFNYKASTQSGELIEGQMEADDREAVVRRLQAQGQIPIRAEELRAEGLRTQGGGRRKRGRVGRRQLGILTLELSILLEAGLPLERALGILTDMAETEALHELLGRLRAAVRGGQDLSSAMEAEPGVFFPLYVNLIRAGEAGGAVDQALARLAEFMERGSELRESVLSALTYPVILIFLAIGSLAIIMALVVPRFATMFADAGASLPVATQIVVAVSQFLESYWWAIALVIGGTVLYARQLMSEPASRLRVDHVLLRLPLWGDFTGKLEVARFSRALGTLLSNGVPMLNALSIARQIVGNQAIATAVTDVTDGVREGQGIARPLLRQGVFPELACHMLQVGEETGQLEHMLMKLADIYDREVRATLNRLVTILEPAIILSLGLLIAGIIFSVLMAILQVNELAF